MNPPRGIKPSTPPVGLLFSQVGYDVGDRVRALVRGPADLIDTDGRLHLSTAPQVPLDVQVPLEPWGELWGSHWWTADFGASVPAGTYELVAVSGGRVALRAEGLLVAEHRLFDETWWLASVGQLEPRTHLAYSKPAWQDAGAQWQECYSHAIAGLGLVDLVEHAGARMTPRQREAVVGQAMVAVNYMVRLQDLAAADGHPPGAMAHDPVKYRTHVLIGNCAKAAALLARAANVLPGDHDTKADWRRRAREAAAFVLNAEPHGAFGFVRHGHGLPADWPVPKEHRTSDLFAVLLAYAELGDREPAASLASRLLDRQVPADRAEDGIFGHFYTFDSADLTERSWSHCLAGGDLGSDGGQALPHYVIGLARMVKRWPDHPDAARWREALQNFASNFLLPVCRKNPFGILPLGYVKGQGWLHFAGPWHGFNASYGWIAAVALELQDHLDLPELRDLAVANLQWVAGLNAGHTQEALEPALMAMQLERELPRGEARPYSMIHGVGQQSLGSWMNLRGSVSNGFCVGEQFQWDVPATAANDGPFSYADEDWIPHALGFVAGVCRL